MLFVFWLCLFVLQQFAKLPDNLTKEDFVRCLILDESIFYFSTLLNDCIIHFSIGVLCSSTCPNDFWGPSCSQTCSCLNEGSCHPSNGTCLCPPGFTGQYCELGKLIVTIQSDHDCPK